MESEDAGAVEKAVALHAEGVDFADALHVESSAAASELVTFDRRLMAARELRSEGPELRLLSATE